MSDDHHFRTPSEEIHALTKELAELRGVIRDVLARLNQIERHVGRAFGSSRPTRTTASPVRAHPERQSSPPRSGAVPSTEQPTMTPREALQLFDSFVAALRADRAATIEDRLDDLEVADLKIMAHELGLSLGRTPSRRNLCSGIIGRVRESVMLSRNVNVTAPASAQQEPPIVPDERGDTSASHEATQQGGAADGAPRRG